MLTTLRRQEPFEKPDPDRNGAAAFRPLGREGNLLDGGGGEGGPTPTDPFVIGTGEVCAKYLRILRDFAKHMSANSSVISHEREKVTFADLSSVS
ncbi:hypothetical protein GWI33_020446 [Rhynchophorus ferrugineus]|uniref:Uncharacterized protein n=1 Tax=Rhynchophorus ferrugineus TaxID=354439 RepID=A0A834HPC9_RHYFE|nr:hypothetical protein GWI33_020446 [Rhynchophorus ferrugineus]